MQAWVLQVLNFPTVQNCAKLLYNNCGCLKRTGWCSSPVARTDGMETKLTAALLDKPFYLFSLYFIFEVAFYLQLGSGLQNEEKASTVESLCNFALTCS